MINANIRIVVLILDEPSFQYNIVSLSEDTIDPPKISIEQYMDIDATIQYLISRYIEMDDTTKFLPYKFSDIHVTDSLELYYITIINHDAQIKNSYKVPVNKYECNLPNMAKILRSLRS